MIVSLAAIGMLLSCGGDEDPQSIQLLANSNIEGGNSASPTNWYTVTANGDASFQWTTEEFASSNRSLKINAVSPITGIAFWAQVFKGTMPVGKDITLTANIKVKNVTGDGAVLSLRADEPGGQNAAAPNHFVTTHRITPITGTADWKSYSVTLKNVPANVTSIYAFLILVEGSAGTVYFDDVTLTYPNK